MPAKRVRLYYLGGLADDGKAHPVEIGGKAFHLPPVGGYWDLPEWRAKIAIEKYRMSGPNGKHYELFTLDPALARMVAKTGKLPQTGGMIAPEDLPTEALKEILRSRGELDQPAIIIKPEPEPIVEITTELEDELVDELGAQDDWQPASPLDEGEPEIEEAATSSKSKKGK